MAKRNSYHPANNEGYDAWTHVKPESSNPYPIGSKEHAHWLKGWHQAGADLNGKSNALSKNDDEDDDGSDEV
jgi:ribosome modulation factor